MLRTMRRFNQMLDEESIQEVLKKGTSGVLALAGDDGYPYAVPISYAYDPQNNCFYFHGAKTGQKIDAMTRNEKASFCVIDKDQIVSERFTTYFRSVIAFGRMHVIVDDTEKKKAIEAIAAKYSHEETEESRENEISKSWKALCLLKLEIEHMTGKQAIELVQKKK